MTPTPIHPTPRLFLLLLLLLAPAALAIPPPSQLTIQHPPSPASHGTGIPGSSPARYCGDPAADLFRIHSVDMLPNPCTIESYCNVKLTGHFDRAPSHPHLSFNVTTRLASGCTGAIRGEDDFCGWVDVVQNETRRCPPEEGPAVIRASVMLPDGWVREANYSLDVRVTSEEGTLFHLCADWEMKLRDGGLK